MSTLKKEFKNLIEVLNQSHSTTADNLLIHLKKKHKDLTHYQIESLLAKCNYRKIKNMSTPSKTKNIYITPLFVYEFLLQDREDILNDPHISPDTRPQVSEDNHKLLLAFSIKLIRIYEFPLTCCTHQEKEPMLYRIKIKCRPESLEFQGKILSLLEDISETQDKIESLDACGNYIILTTMNKKFAHSIYKMLWEPYTKLWQESDSFLSTSISFNLSYKNEPTTTDYESVRDRFLSYLDDKYPNPQEKI